jgi:hypothetical protein
VNTQADWIPLMDYATKSGVSLSTLRRHIKANKIPYKIENGRYLLCFKDAQQSTQPSPEASTYVHALSKPSTPAPTNETHDLYLRLQAAREEIAELKMLVAIYEEQLAQPKQGATSAPSTKSDSLRMNGY